jgi:hypothetical protein
MVNSVTAGPATTGGTVVGTTPDGWVAGATVVAAGPQAVITSTRISVSANANFLNMFFLLLEL